MLCLALRYIRKYHKLTPAQLSEKIEYPTKLIRSWEYGGKPISFKALQAYSTTFDISLNQIVLLAECCGRVTKHALNTELLLHPSTRKILEESRKPK